VGWSGKGNLLRLSLAGNPIGGGLAALTAGEPFERLLELDLRDCQLRPADLAALAAAPLRVRRLDLSNNRAIDSDGLIALLSADWLGEIERLDLSSTGVGADGMRALTACDRLTNLRHLACKDGSPFDARSLRSIVFSPHWKNLQCLDVRRTSGRYSNDVLKAAQQRGLTILY
jgi:hypothetical protein